MSAENKNLITHLKEHGQDFEFYPTTHEIIERIYRDMESGGYGDKILDIGAGGGNFFKVLDGIDKRTKKDDKEWESPFTKYAIEKSGILLNNLSPDVFVVGTDFHQQTLIDKNMDVIFCNPPYSEFDIWAKRIIKEANADVVYLVIPVRWKENKALTAAIKQREAQVKIIGSFDFLNAEFREARAKIDIVKVVLKEDWRRERCKTDPFAIWFKESFKFEADTDKEDEYDFKKKKTEEIQHSIVKGQNLIERLEELYSTDFTKLLDNYRAIERLDKDIFKELNVNLEGIREGLQLKIKGLKNIYWNQLFDHLDVINKRLTFSSRQKLLGTLLEHTSVDFTSHNAYSIVLWAIKNANAYMDEQLKELYLWMSSYENVVNYKSNTRTFEKDGWRWSQYAGKEYTHFKLDYRLVFKCYDNFATDRFSGYQYPQGLNKKTHERIDDIITIANNLGFSVEQKSESFYWEPGRANTFTQNSEDITKDFMEIKAFKNGNIHVKLCVEFCKALNIEAGRILGWVRSAQEASEEMDMPLQEVTKYFHRNTAAKLGQDHIKLLA